MAWVSKNQDAVALSTADAEYSAIAEVVQRAVYAQNLLGTIQEQKRTVSFETDNQPALDMVRALGNTTRSKFIDILHHYIKDQIRDNNIAIKHVRSEDQDADIFTKPMGRIKFVENRQRIGVERIDEIDQNVTSNTG